MPHEPNAHDSDTEAATDSNGVDYADTAHGTEISYVAALTELEEILDELDRDEVDVDLLGARVERAAELLRLCRDRITGARLRVEQVVAELEAESVPAPSDPNESLED